MPQIRPEQIVDTSQDPGLTQVNRRTESIHRVKNSNINASTNTYLLNWTKDRIDNRDYLYSPPPTLSIQSSVDLRNLCTPIEDQGNIGSCTGQAITSAIEIILKRKGTTLELSRLFVYYQERLLEGTVAFDAGAYLRSGIKACYTWGTPRESLWGYNTRLFATKPPTAAYTEALTRKITRYERCTNFDTVRAALSAGNPVVVGFLVYPSFLSPSVAQTGIMPYPGAKEKILGGHAVCLVGYDDRRQVFIAKNSWGVRWGDRGYFYMPYRVIQNQQMSSDFWTITDVTG